MKEFNTSKDFHKVGYTYAFFWWGLFTLYCMAHQIDRFLIYRTRRLRSQGKVMPEPFSILGFFSRLFSPFEHVINIPFVTTWMPVKHIIGVSFFVIINVIWICLAPFKLADNKTWDNIMNISLMDRRAAYVGMVNWGFVYILGSRNNVITRMSGLSFEGLIPFHRWLARIGFIEYIPHFVYRIMRGYQRDHIVKDALFRNIEQGTGTVSMIGFLLLFVTSFEWIRRNYFEIFYYFHIIGIIIATITACWHETGCFYYFIPAVLLWAFDRIWRTYQSWWSSYHHTSLLNVESFHNHANNKDGQQKQGVVQVLFEYGRLQHYRPGQYVFVTLVNKTKNAFWNYANWHPMTISEVFQPATTLNKTRKELNEKVTTYSSDKKTSGDKKVQDKLPIEESAATTTSSSSSSSNNSSTGDNIKNRRYRKQGDVPSASLHIKALGSYTHDLLQAGIEHDELDLKVDGPYGPRLEYQDYKTMGCFAAGIGITPALTLIKDCIERRAAGVDTVITDQVHLVWAIRTLDELTPFTDLIIYWTEQCSNATNPIQLYLDIYVTRQTSNNNEQGQKHWIETLNNCNVTYNSRPDIENCMNRMEDMTSDKKSVWVHTCGSDDFMRVIMNQAIKHHWNVHHETFEF